MIEIPTTTVTCEACEETRSPTHGFKHGFSWRKPYSQRKFQNFVTEISSALSFHPPICKRAKRVCSHSTVGICDEGWLLYY